MKEIIRKKILSRFVKDEMINYINSNQEFFPILVDLSFCSEQKVSWRASWLIVQTMKQNDARLQNYIKDYILFLKLQNDGHQREILKIIEKMDVSDDNLGILYEECFSIWKNVDKDSSVRITALRIITSIVQKYPDLVNEIELFLGKEYFESLSKGILFTFKTLSKTIFSIKYK